MLDVHWTGRLIDEDTRVTAGYAKHCHAEATSRSDRDHTLCRASGDHLRGHGSAQHRPARRFLLISGTTDVDVFAPDCDTRLVRALEHADGAVGGHRAHGGLKRAVLRAGKDDLSCR